VRTRNRKASRAKLAIGSRLLEGELPVPMVWVLRVSFVRDQRVGCAFDGASIGGEGAGGRANSYGPWFYSVNYTIKIPLRFALAKQQG
jgi:hypothetical protein